MPASVQVSGETCDEVDAWTLIAALLKQLTVALSLNRSTSARQSTTVYDVFWYNYKGYRFVFKKNIQIDDCISQTAFWFSCVLLMCAF